MQPLEMPAQNGDTDKADSQTLLRHFRVFTFSRLSLASLQLPALPQLSRRIRPHLPDERARCSHLVPLQLHVIGFSHGQILQPDWLRGPDATLSRTGRCHAQFHFSLISPYRALIRIPYLHPYFKVQLDRDPRCPRKQPPAVACQCWASFP